MYVEFVTDDHFRHCVRYVLVAFYNVAELKQSILLALEKGDIFKSTLFSNVVDPFKMIFEIERIGVEEWVKKEVLRQLDKSIEQKMGEFHQKFPGGVAGWEDLGIGQAVDLKDEAGKVFIELKTNTILVIPMP